MAVWSIVFSVGIFATTIQSQDFKDIDGDKAIGRQTIPIVWGRFAKYTVIVPLLAWSVGLSIAWQLDWMAGAAFVALATFIGLQYVVGHTVREYQVAFYWYNVSGFRILVNSGVA